MRSSSTPLILASSLLKLADASTHYLFSSAYSGSTIGTLGYDDETESLFYVKDNTLTVDSGSSWITIDERHENLYVSTTGYFQSYAIGKNLTLEYQSNITATAECASTKFGTVSAMTASPYTAILTSFSSGCASRAASVSPSGSLSTVFANVTYDSTAAVHGTALSPDNAFIYSADDRGNALWTHSIDSTTGEVEMLQKLTPSTTGADPRHVVVHPNGEWVYAVYEGPSAIGSFKRDPETGLVTEGNGTWSLIPAGFNTSLYTADELLFSLPLDSYGGGGAAAALSPKYLIASTRGRSTTTPGYVSVFALDSTTGAITAQSILTPTTGSGGSSNTVSPAPFDEETFAITDAGGKFIEVWKINENGSEAGVVAHLDTTFDPSNVVWYN